MHTEPSAGKHATGVGEKTSRQSCERSAGRVVHTLVSYYIYMQYGGPGRWI